MNIRMTRDPDTDHLIPQYPADLENIQKLQPGRTINCKITSRRSNKSNSKIWGLCNYFWHNLPDRFWHLDENDTLQRAFGSVRSLYEYLKLAVGFCETVQIRNEIIRIPRHTNFDALEDEVKYLEEFNKPAIDHLAYMMDTDVPGLWEGFHGWMEEKNSRAKPQ